MAGEPLPVDELAEAVLEGHLVDWASAESSPGAPALEVVQQLKVLAGIAELHRKLTRDTPVSEQHTIPEKRLERWGRLEILEHIGQGSFGEVYRAWDAKLDREVAVKLLHASRAQPERETVLQEARLLARVRHPNVVTVYDADETEGRVGLWMEFIHGRNLEQILAEGKTFPCTEATSIGVELCRALSAVHGAGLLHRDIKAQNLMQATDGRLVLMDFGTGRDLEAAPASIRDTAGTPLYLAPEIFGGAAATVRADIYSAGVVLFHLLTGSYPVRGETVKDVGAAHARGERPNPAAAAGTSRALGAVIARAIEPDPSKRFESARDMLTALERIQRRTEARKARLFALALGAVSVAAIAFAVVQRVTRHDGGQDPKSQPGGGLYYGSTPDKRAVRVPFVLMTGTPSPDGRYLPYSDADTGNLGLYEFATGASRLLTNTGDGGNENYATESIVSADGARVAYTWVDGSCDCVQLRVIDAAGGQPRVLYGGRGLMEVLPLEWFHDGSQILVTRHQSPDEIQVLLISAADGSTRVIRTFPRGPGRISLSPDDRHLAYDRAEDSDDSDNGIYISELDGTGEVPVVTGPTEDSEPMWTPDGSGLVFTSMRTGGSGLWLQPVKDGRAEGKPRLLDKNMGVFAPVTLTQRGSLFYNHRTGLMDVYTVPIDPATGQVHGEPQNAASRSLGSNTAPDWSPDGRTLVFASWRTLSGPGRNILVFHSMDTGQERELALDMDQVNGPRWSPDGRVMAVKGPDGRGVGALRMIDVESGKILSTFFPQTTDVPPLNGFAWSPEGRYAYVKRPSRSGITKLDVNTGEETLVYEPPSDAAPNNFSLSPDGRWLAFVLYMRTANTWRLIAIPTDGAQPRDVLQTPGRLIVGGWARDGRQILYSSVTRDENNKQQGELWAVPFAGGAPRRLGLSMPSMRDISVSPDGSRIAFTSGFPDQGLWVFESFLPKASP